MLEITTDAGRLAVRYQDAGKLVASNILRALRDVGLHLVRAIKTDQLSGQTLQPRSGRLRQSVRFMVGMDGRDAVVSVGFDPGIAKYGGIQERGGTITAKGKKLTIPLEAAKTAAGVPKFTARELFDNPGAFGYKHVFVAKGVIFGFKAGGVKGRSGMVSTVPLFVLKQSVKVPERAPLRKALAAERGWIEQRVGVATAEAMTQLQGGA